MKKLIKIIAIFLITISVFAFFAKKIPVIKEASNMYEEAVSKTPVDEMVDTIRSKDDYLTLDEIPKTYIDNLLQSEDRRFYYHFGIDPIAIVRAAYHDLKAGELVEGGSTITQQLAKNMYFPFEKRFERKIAEMLVAFDLERKYTKDEILELYCNITYFGENCYGIKEASLHYYNVLPKNLTNTQCQALVYTLKCPNEFNPNAIKNSSAKTILVDVTNKKTTESISVVFYLIQGTLLTLYERHHSPVSRRQRELYVCQASLPW